MLAIDHHVRASVPAQAPFQITLLGTPGWSRDGAASAPLERHDAALLALLAVDGATPRSRAAQLLWSTASREQAARNLRQRLFRLRRKTGLALIEGDGTLALAGFVATDLTGLAERLEASAEGGAGELLGSLDYDADGAELAHWVADLRARWRSVRAGLLADAAERRESDGRLAEALPYAERLVADEPTAEHAHRRVMRLHYRRGDRAGALAAFDRCRAVLHRELGEAPGDETLLLAQTVARGDDSVMPVAAPTLVLLRPPLMVGRAAPLAAVAQAWQRGAPVLLVGEPGIGKSRFMQALAGVQPGRVIVGARAGEDQIHYQLLRTVLRAALQSSAAAVSVPATAVELRRILPELGAPPPGDLVPALLHQAARAVLGNACAAGVIAVLVDDLQFADPASIDALLHCAAAPGPALHWLFAHRAGEAPAALTSWRDGAAGEAAFELRLPALDEAAVAELLDSLALPGVTATACAAALWQHAGGNPMLTLETLRAGLPRQAVSQTGAATVAGMAAIGLSLPEHVSQLIERRLARLPESALALARLAALAGVDFSVALASRLLGRHALDLVADWRTLESAQVLRGPAFAHDLVREAVLRTVPQAIALELHRLIAPVAAALGAPAARVAAQWEQAAQWQQAGSAFDEAAAAARLAGLRQAELALADRAAACWRRQPSAVREFGSACRAARAALSMSSVEDAAARISRLEALALGDAQAAEWHFLRGMLAVNQGHPADAVAPAQAALDRLRTLHAPDAAPLGDRLHLEVVALLGASLASAGRGEEGVALFAPVLPIVAAEPDLALRASVLSSHGFALSMAGRAREALPSWRAAAAAATEAGLVTEAMTDLSNIAGSLAQWGDAQGGFEASRQALELGASRGVVTGSLMVIARQTFGGLAITVSRYDDAERALQQALADNGSTGALAVFITHQLANLYLHLGQHARAAQNLSLLPDGEPGHWRRALLQARLARALGQPALPHLQQALRRWRPRNLPLTRMGIELELAAELPPAEALLLCRGVLNAATSAGLHAVHLVAQLRLAQVLVKHSEHAQAAGLAHAAMQRADSVAPHDVYRGAFWWQLAQVFTAVDEPAPYTLAVQRGLQWMEAALPQVAPAYRESFLERQAANRALRAAAQAFPAPE